MTVRELIESLEGCDQEAEVLFTYDYGDYQKTKVAAKIDGVEESGRVVYSAYHRMYRVVDDEEDGEDEGEVLTDVRCVCLLM